MDMILQTTFVLQKVVSTLRTARLPADMVAVEQDSTSATESMIATEQQSLAQMKQLEVNHIPANLLHISFISLFTLFPPLTHSPILLCKLSQFFLWYPLV